MTAPDPEQSTFGCQSIGGAYGLERALFRVPFFRRIFVHRAFGDLGQRQIRGLFFLEGLLQQSSDTRLAEYSRIVRTVP
jgi:hypothetical protein